MLLNTFRRWNGMYHQIGLFLLLLMDNAATEDLKYTDKSEEFNYNIAIDETTPSFKDVDGNVDANFSGSFRNLHHKHVEMRSSLIRYGIIPDVLANSPSYLTQVIYSSKCEVKFGNKIAPEKLQRQPRKVVWPWHDDSFYTLILVDADVPSRQDRKYSQRLHWLVVNIPGYRLNEGDNVVEYIGPQVPSHKGMHRYIFTVFKQYSRLDYKEKRIKALPHRLHPDRLNFSIRGFATKYRLKEPISVNFFLAGWPLNQSVPMVSPSSSLRRHRPSARKSSNS